MLTMRKAKAAGATSATCCSTAPFSGSAHVSSPHDIDLAWVGSIPLIAARDERFASSGRVAVPFEYSTIVSVSLRSLFSSVGVVAMGYESPAPEAVSA